jgi:hypothetical protein
MPFDNAPETAPSEELSPYERLKILRELVPKSGNQGFGAPVYGASRGGTSACARPGLARYDIATGMGPRPGVNDFFGGHYFWGAASTAAKAAAIDAAIAAQPVVRRRILEKV